MFRCDSRPPRVSAGRASRAEQPGDCAKLYTIYTLPACAVSGVTQSTTANLAKRPSTVLKQVSTLSQCFPHPATTYWCPVTRFAGLPYTPPFRGNSFTAFHRDSVPIGWSFFLRSGSSAVPPWCVFVLALLLRIPSFHVFCSVLVPSSLFPHSALHACVFPCLCMPVL